VDQLSYQYCYKVTKLWNFSQSCFISCDTIMC